jgi:hypothetical protein
MSVIASGSEARACPGSNAAGSRFPLQLRARITGLAGFPLQSLTRSILGLLLVVPHLSSAQTDCRWSRGDSAYIDGDSVKLVATTVLTSKTVETCVDGQKVRVLRGGSKKSMIQVATAYTDSGWVSGEKLRWNERSVVLGFQPACDMTWWMLESSKEQEELEERRSCLFDAFQLAGDYDRLAACAEDAEDYPEAIRYVTLLINLFERRDYEIGSIFHYGTVAERLQRRGRLKVLASDHRGAILDLTKSIEKYASDSESYVLRGFSRMQLGVLDLALQDFNKAISLDSENAQAYYYRGFAHLQKGSKSQGCLDLSKAGELGFKEAYPAIEENCN